MPAIDIPDPLPPAITPAPHSHRIPHRPRPRRVWRRLPGRPHLPLGRARIWTRADPPHGLVAIRRRRAAIGCHPRRGKYRNEPPLYPHTPWPEANEARFACWLCTSVPGDEVPLQFRPWDAAPARARGDYYRG